MIKKSIVPPCEVGGVALLSGCAKGEAAVQLRVVLGWGKGSARVGLQARLPLNNIHLFMFNTLALY